MGYHRAGFEVVGVDNRPQKNYPFEFIQMDAFEALERFGPHFDAIHASPPCQQYSVLLGNKARTHPDLYGPIRSRLEFLDVPWVIENVIGAPYNSGIVLCGSMFNLPVRRHRNFESNFLMLNGYYCQHKKQGRPITVTGHGGDRNKLAKHSWKGIYQEWPQYMGMDWATPLEAAQGIPPAYTEYIGNMMRQMLFKAG